MCDPDVAFHRLGLNKAMKATIGRSLNMTNVFGNSKGLFRACRSTHGKGYMVNLRLYFRKKLLICTPSILVMLEFDLSFLIFF